MKTSVLFLAVFSLLMLTSCQSTNKAPPRAPSTPTPIQNFEQKLIEYGDLQGAWELNSESQPYQNVDAFFFHKENGLMGGVIFSHAGKCGGILEQVDSRNEPRNTFNVISYFKQDDNGSGMVFTRSCNNVAEAEVRYYDNYIVLDSRGYNQRTLRKVEVKSYQTTVARTAGFSGFYRQYALIEIWKRWIGKVSQRHDSDSSHQATVDRIRAEKLKNYIEFTERDFDTIHLAGEIVYRGANYTIHRGLHDIGTQFIGSHYFLEDRNNKYNLTYSVVFDVPPDFEFDKEFLQREIFENPEFRQAISPAWFEGIQIKINIYIKNTVILDNYISSGEEYDEDLLGFLSVPEARAAIATNFRLLQKQMPLVALQINKSSVYRNNIAYFVQYRDRHRQRFDEVDWENNQLGSLNKLIYQDSINYGEERTSERTARLKRERQAFEARSRSQFSQKYGADIASLLIIGLIEGDEKIILAGLKGQYRNNAMTPLLRTYWYTYDELCGSNTVGTPYKRGWAPVWNDTGERIAYLNERYLFMSEAFSTVNIKLTGSLAGIAWWIENDKQFENDFRLLVEHNGCASAPFAIFEQNLLKEF